MNTAQKIESATKILAQVTEARGLLENALSVLASANALVAQDPSGEPEEIDAIVDALENVKSTVALEVYRWDTYLDNRE